MSFREQVEHQLNEVTGSVGPRDLAEFIKQELEKTQAFRSLMPAVERVKIMGDTLIVYTNTGDVFKVAISRIS